VETTVRNGLGETLLVAGKARLAATHVTAALELAEQTGHRDEQARAQHALAQAHAALGDHDRAHRHLHEAFRLYRALGVPEAEQIRSRLQVVPAEDPVPRAGLRGESQSVRDGDVHQVAPFCGAQEA
jgi:predicted Zn-dependent protease